MKNFYVIIVILLLRSFSLAQTFSISGHITDQSNLPLPLTNIYIIELNLGSTSDANGNYRIKNLPPGKYTIQFSFIGYQKKTDVIEIEDRDIIYDAVLSMEIIETSDVIVTAGKYEQKQSELPVSAFLIRSSFIKSKNISNLEEAFRYVPGINMTEDQISIRGSSGYSRGTGSRVLLALDGIPFYTGDSGETIWELVPVNSIEKVEIIKGAASSLYGSTAIGGVVNVITQPISDIPSTFIRAFIGLYDNPFYDEWKWSEHIRLYNGFTASHSRKLGSFSFNLAFTRLESQGYKQSGFYHKYIGFAKLNYFFTPATSIKLIFNSLNKRSGNFLYWKNSTNALIPPDDSQGERVETNRYLSALIFKTTFNPKFIFESKLSYYLNKWSDNSDSQNRSSSNIVRGEIQLSNFINDYVVNISGLEAAYSKVESNIFGDRNSHLIGVYSQVDLKLFEALTSTLGIRYDFNQIEGLNGNSYLSPKIGFNFKAHQNLIFRTSAGWGFRAPSLAESFTSTSTGGVTVKPNPEIKPEKNFNIELALNYKLIENMQFDIALFDNELYDFIEPSVDPLDGLIIFDNVTRARIQGSEIALDISLLNKTILLTFGYTYLWTRDLNSNKELKYRPRNTLITSLDYNFQNINLGCNFRYSSRVEEIDDALKFIVPDADLRTEVFLLDADAGYYFKDFSLPIRINLFANNLLNYNYVELMGNLQPIRNFSLSVELNF